ncbi:retrovirus-related pol polyprotein from transposon TNT 1-94 [Tanacetum coccineum]
MTDTTALLQALQAIQQQLQQQLQQLQQQSQQQTEQNTKILEALQYMNIREQPKRDNSSYVSSSDEDKEGDQADPTNNQRNRMPRIKADIPTFSGSLNIEDFLDWVSETEKNFELMDIPEDSQVKYVAYKLRGSTSSWWDNLQTVARFNNGLRYDIQAIISLQTSWTFDEAVRMALKAELTISKGKSNSKFKNKLDLNQSSNQSGEKTQPLNSTEKNKSTYASTSSQATKKLINQYARPVGNKCFKCQKTGHTFNQCRAKAVNVAERGEWYKDESENEECFIRPEDVLDEEEDEEHEAYSYVVRRLMLTTPKKDVVNVIIDGGSRENIISRDIISRLKLPPRKHPTPYKIGWIKAVAEVRVTEQCEVLISMGKYKDMVLFDIVDMDACHVLLGRPWQFDLGVIHKGKENTYTFLKDGKKFTLCPFSREDRPKVTKEKAITILLCSREAFLAEFKNIMPEELSDGLPSLRGIQHQIEFVPGASLTNLPYYRMSLTEHDILQGMVEELLRKGVIQESKSLCAVPALLVPKKDKTCSPKLIFVAVITNFEFVSEMNRRLLLRQKKAFTSGFNTEDEHLDHLRGVLKVFQEHPLFVNLKKCSFVTRKLLFLGFVVSDDGIHVDDEKIKVIQEWPTPQTIGDVQSFHGLATFYRRFIRYFSTNMAPITECLKKGQNDASIIGVGAVLSQERRPVAFFSEKLSEARRKWTTYELEFYWGGTESVGGEWGGGLGAGGLVWIVEKFCMVCLRVLIEPWALELRKEKENEFYLSLEDKDRYNADIRATNILLQGLPKDIYTLINHYTDAKDIWDNVKMLLEGSELTKEDRESQLYDDFEHFSVKLNRGLRDSNNDQLYAYLKQHKAHANEKKMMLDRFTQHTVDPLALMSNVSHQQYYSQSSTTPPSTYVPSHFGDNTPLDLGLSPTDKLIENLTNTLALLTQSYKTYLPQTNNQLRTSSNTRNQATVQDGQARQIKCYNCNGIGHKARNCTQPKRPQNSEYFKDKMLLMQDQENRVTLDEEQLLFLVADDCDAFDSDIDEAPTAQTMFMANLSSAYPVYDEASPSYDSNILSEVHDHDHYQDVVCEHHEVYEMHDDVQPNYVVDSHADYTSDGNMTLYGQYVKDNAMSVVQSNVSSIPNDAYMMILNDIYELPAQCVSVTTQNNVVDNSLTAELYETRAKFELTEREQKINEHLRIVITDRNRKEESLKKELHSKENKYLEEFLDMKALKEKVEDKLYKQDQSLQTVHMLCKPKPYYDEQNKVAIGYKNPLCLTCAQQVQPTLYNGQEIIKTNHVPAIVHNTKDTLEIAEMTMKKMNNKMKDPECVNHKVKIAPPDYSKENYLATFTPQKQLTPEQIFWSQDLINMKEEALKNQTTASRPIKALTVYPSNTPATLVPRVLPTKRVNSCTNVSGSQPRSNTKKNRISPAKSVNKKKVEEHTRTNKSSLKTKNPVNSSISFKRTIINSNSHFVCQTCNKCLISANHDMCVVDYLHSMKASPSIHNVVRKVKQVWKPKQVRKVWKATGKVLTNVGHQWRPTGRIFTLGEQCPLTRLTKPKVVSAKQTENQAITCANQQEPNQN